MTRNLAIKLAAGMFTVSVAGAIDSIFVDQDAFMAATLIYSCFAMLYIFRNPRVMLSKSFDEFGDEYDKSRNKNLIRGSLPFHGLVLASFLYIYLV